MAAPTLREARFPDDDDALQAHERAFEDDRRIDAEVGREWLDELKRRIAEQVGFVRIAEVDGRPAGWVVCLEEPEPLYVEAPLRPLLNVQELYVDEERRGRGVGRALLAAAEAEARRRGRKRLGIGVLDRNAPARAAYAAFGFRDFARWMVKPLDYGADTAPAAAGGERPQLDQ